MRALIKNLVKTFCPAFVLYEDVVFFLPAVVIVLEFLTDTPNDLIGIGLLKLICCEKALHGGLCPFDLAVMEVPERRVDVMTVAD